MYCLNPRVMNKIISSLLIVLAPILAVGQSNPTALVPGIDIQRMMTVGDGVVRMVLDPVQGDLLYTNTSGDIYRVYSNGAQFTDSLLYTAADHGVAYVQGMIAHDSVLYVSGNIDSNTPLTQGKIVRGVLQANGTRQWSTVMLTEPYETADYFDHLLSGIAISNDGDSLAVCNGARGDHGEIQTRYGTYPGLRNVPLTTHVFLIPTRNAGVITLPNDSVDLASSPYLFASGIRNTFDMAYDAEGRLFGVENSGDYDHNEEMNWLRRGRHYGFPWRMGTSFNPQQFPDFDPLTDSLIPRFSRTWREGFWTNDPSFPPPPSGIVFEDPIMNIGPDADKFRDSTGAVNDASDLGIPIGTFTAHRSPLGLVFDKDSVLAPGFKADAFMLSWTQGRDSCGCYLSPSGNYSIGPFVDPSQDLLQLHLVYDSLIDNFTLSATRIIGDFSRPVDAELDGNVLYVIENGYAGTSGLYRITLPADSSLIGCNAPANDSCLRAINLGTDLGLSSCSDSAFTYQDSTTCATPDLLAACNTGSDAFKSDTWYRFDASGRELNLVVAGDAPAKLGLYSGSTCDSLVVVACYDSITVADTLSLNAAGTHWLRISSMVDSLPLHFEMQVFSPALSLNISNIQGTSCIGCQDGRVEFQVVNGSAPFILSITPDTAGTINATAVENLPAGSYQLCVTDFTGCEVCDSLTILEAPSGITGAAATGDVFSLFPNPVSDRLMLVVTPTMIGKECRIVDSRGRLVLNQVIEKEKAWFDTRSWNAGVYTVHINGRRQRFLVVR